MQKQLENRQIQINSLDEKIRLLQHTLTSQVDCNKNQQQIDQLTMESMNTFIQYYKNHIRQMKQQLQTINQNS